MKLTRTFLKHRNRISWFADISIATLGILKLTFLTVDQEQANLVIFESLKNNTLALNSLYQYEESSDKVFLQETEKSISLSTNDIIQYYGERIPGCYFEEAELPGSNIKVKNLNITVRHQSPAGKLVDLEMIKGGIEKVDGEKCNPPPLFVGLAEKLVKTTRYGHLIEIFISVLVLLKLFLTYVQNKVDSKYPIKRKNERSIPRHLR